VVVFIVWLIISFVYISRDFFVEAVVWLIRRLESVKLPSRRQTKRDDNQHDVVQLYNWNGRKVHSATHLTIEVDHFAALSRILGVKTRTERKERWRVGKCWKREMRGCKGKSIARSFIRYVRYFLMYRTVRVCSTSFYRTLHTGIVVGRVTVCTQYIIIGIAVRRCF